MTVDGGPAEIVDTYAADDIWGVPAFRKTLPTAGPHTLRIEVLGEHNEQSIGNAVYLDAVRAEP